MRHLPAVAAGALLSLLPAGAAFAQAAPAGAGVPLNSLLAEAERDNPSLRATRMGWRAAAEVPSQVSTLPDPQVQLQQLSVGSPRPFAGYSTSESAYIGLGVSQDIPFPGKLRLRGKIAARDAEAAGQDYEAMRLKVLAAVKTEYFQLAYVDKTLGILESDGALLKQVAEAASARYRSGMGSQQDLVQAQLEQTKLLEEITQRELEADRSQAQLKELLDRPQSSSDIQPSELAETPLPRTYSDLLAAAQAQNPDIGAAKTRIDMESLQVDLARKDFYPDFTVQYMVQRTDPERYRAMYMATLGIQVPLFARRKQRHELAQARERYEQSRSDYEAQSAAVAGQLRDQYVVADRTAQLLRIYREGLGPQARAEFRAALAGYETGRQDFQALLGAFLDVLNLDQAYWRNLAAYESAVAVLEELSGIDLRTEGTHR